jgi:hypothetical protein
MRSLVRRVPDVQSGLSTDLTLYLVCQRTFVVGLNMSVLLRELTIGFHL